MWGFILWTCFLRGAIFLPCLTMVCVWILTCSSDSMDLQGRIPWPHEKNIKEKGEKISPSILLKRVWYDSGDTLSQAGHLSLCASHSLHGKSVWESLCMSVWESMCMSVWVSVWESLYMCECVYECVSEWQCVARAGGSLTNSGSERFTAPRNNSCSQQQ